MKVTDLQYSMEKRLIAKLDIMIKRCTGDRKLDNLIIVDGDEGYGKSNMAKALAYYFSYKTGRPFGLENMFFDANEMLEFAKKTEDQIIVWDEAALQGLASDWQNKTQKNLIKMLMVARKKRHIWIFNIPKFFKLSEYLVMDRAIALIHVYARQNITLGRFTYYKKNALQRLYSDWRKKKIRAYKKYKTLQGTFPDMTDKVFSEKEYDEKKDKAIMSVGEKTDFTKTQLKVRLLEHRISAFARYLKEKYKIPEQETFNHYDYGERTHQKRLKRIKDGEITLFS